jgi:glycosyltransferase involved in cell wall biosynthesis
MKLLFLLKKRETTYGESSMISPSKYCISTGLLNSATFVVQMLKKNGIAAEIVCVNDNNDIDREVTKHRPTHVIVEAFWVVPEKFDVLQRLHPSVTWIVRNHSEMPFLSVEGIAIKWTLEYIERGVILAPNSRHAYKDTVKMVTAAFDKETADGLVWYLPNFYPVGEQDFDDVIPDSDTLDVGCFGAIRPLKNQFIQAIAAVNFAQTHNKKLNFHINVARLEDNGNAVLKSIRSFFDRLPTDQFQLVEHGWLSHGQFKELIKTMDIGLQASFTESFNIVTADFVAVGVPIVVSKEVFWMPETFYCDPTDTDSIQNRMEELLYGFCFFSREKKALRALKKYDANSVVIWTTSFSG